MKRKIVLGCLLPLIVVSGLGWWGYRRVFRKPPTPVRFARVDRGAVDITVVETGAIEPLRKVEIKSKVAGRLDRLYVREGDHVVAGQVLVEIDPTEINSQVAQIRAQVDGARARLEQAVRGAAYQRAQTRSGITQAEQGVATAEARLRSAEKEHRVQPDIVASDVKQAEAALYTAEQGLTLLRTSTHPLALVQARTTYTEAAAASDQATRNLDRRQSLLQKGFAAPQTVDAAASEKAAASARLEQAKKRLDLIIEQQKLEVSEAESRVRQARAALDRAGASTSLLSVNEDNVRAARAALEQAKAQLRGAVAGNRQDRMRDDDVKQARSSVVQIENQLREFEVRQRDTRLVATMSGVITKRYVEPGELITSGVSTFSSGTPVLQIADLSRMLIKASVNEVDVHKLKVNLPAEIAIDGVRGARFKGLVSKVAPAAIGAGETAAALQRGDGAVIRFAVEIEVSQADQRLRPGMSARCTVVVARRTNVLRLPADAVDGDGANATVEKAIETKKNGKPSVRYVKQKIVAGLRGDSFIEIVSGLKAGERTKPGLYKGPKRKAIDINFG